MLTYAPYSYYVLEPVSLVYADVCRRMRMLTYADVCPLQLLRAGTCLACIRQRRRLVSLGAALLVPVLTLLAFTSTKLVQKCKY